MFQRLVLILFAVVFGCSDASSPDNSNERQVYTQKAIIATMVPILKSEGKTYKKFKKVFAREAVEGESIETVTDDGVETTNKAKAGDFIIKNQTEAGEMYIIGAEKFQDRYDFLEEGSDGFALYSPKGKAVAVEMNEELLKRLGLQNEFYLIAPWGEEMVVKKDDYLASPLDFSEVYRIARKEFFETYQPGE